MSDVKNKSVFETLSAINVSSHTEKKNGLTYLSWAWAWHIVKSNYPDAFYTVYEAPNGLIYFSDGRTAWVKTGVNIDGLELIEYLPVMDFKNNSIPVDRLTSFDVNKAIQRSLTKACARHGLGLSVYAGEDLPLEETEAREPVKAKAPAKKAPAQTKSNVPVCAVCGKAIEAGGNMTAEQVAQASIKKYTQALCQAHRNERKKQLEEAQSAADDVQLPFEIE